MLIIHDVQVLTPTVSVFSSAHTSVSSWTTGWRWPIMLHWFVTRRTIICDRSDQYYSHCCLFWDAAKTLVQIQIQLPELLQLRSVRHHQQSFSTTPVRIERRMLCTPVIED